MNQPRYPGWGSSPEFFADEVPGHITVSSEGLCFESEAGQIGIPLGRLEFDRDSAGRLVITDAAQADVYLATARDALLGDYVLRHHNGARAEIRRFRQSQEGRRTLKLTLVFLAVCAGVILALSVGGRLATGFVVTHISPAYEIELGQEVLDELELPFEEAPKLQTWLQELLTRITDGLPESERSRYQWRVQIVANPFPNALSIPGGTILVTTGLLHHGMEPDEIAAVLAHEIAHVTRRHGLRSLIRVLGPYYALQVFTSDRQAFLRGVGTAAVIVSQQHYSQKQEFEADAAAYELLKLARLDPRGLVRALEGLRRSGERSRAMVETPRFLLSHPPDEERIQRLNERSARAPAGGPFDPLPRRPQP
jgi:beta-barrel assembly-enhancing protease